MKETLLPPWVIPSPPSRLSVEDSAWGLVPSCGCNCNEEEEEEERWEAEHWEKDKSGIVEVWIQTRFPPIDTNVFKFCFFQQVNKYISERMHHLQCFYPVTSPGAIADPQTEFSLRKTAVVEI